MDRKRVLLIIPTILLPYAVLFALATIFFSSDIPFFRNIMESVFCNNALFLIAVFLLFSLFAAVLSFIYFIKSIRGGWDALSMAKCAVTVKLIQAPAYILIFILGVFLTIAVWTIPFSVGMFLIDCFTLLLTCLLTVSAVILSVQQNFFRFKDVLWVILMQFIFCADVVSSIVFYSKLKKISGEKQAQNI